MNIKEYEELIVEQLKEVVDTIINDNLELKISAKSRAGAEISDWIEEEFVKNTQNSEYFKNSEAAPKGKTKNPWDARTFFNFNNNSEEIWIDFKALKVSSANSNPDIGTPNKIIDFINIGKFYLVYVYVYYKSKGDGLEFVKLNDNYSKIYFLKDISKTFRRNPKNQLQVNMSEDSNYRSREDFIKLLVTKIKESHERQIEISNKALNNIDEVETKLIDSNQKSENELLKKIQ